VVVQGAALLVGVLGPAILHVSDFFGDFDFVFISHDDDVGWFYSPGSLILLTRLEFVVNRLLDLIEI
jgi:hypothetical protein